LPVVIAPDRLLVDLLFRGDGRVAHEVDRQVEQRLALRAGQHVLDRGDEALGLQIAAAHSERAGVQHR
jgi:hypothetical protein